MVFIFWLAKLKRILKKLNDRKKIIIGSDHAGFEMKHSIISNLSDIEFDDIGTDSDESVDKPVSKRTQVKTNKRG